MIANLANHKRDMPTAMQQHRLFFALWPDPGVRAALAQVQAGITGTLMPAEKLHLTLAFLGQQPASALPALCRVLDQVPAQPMALQLDIQGYFTSLRIAWAGMRSVPPKLLELRGALMQMLAASRFVPEFEKDRFEPHVTLARKAGSGAAAVGASAIPPIRWLATQMVLAESFTGTGEYRIIATRQLD